MSFESIVVIILLGIIIYQLNKLIKVNNFEIEKREKERDQEKEEKRIRGLMPHLFKDSSSQEQIDELKTFYHNQEEYFKSSSQKAPVAYYIEEMEEKIKNEQDKTKKQTMEKCFAEINNDKGELIRKLKNEKEIEQYELEFVLWRFYKKASTLSLEISPRAMVIDIDMIIAYYSDIFPNKKK